MQSELYTNDSFHISNFEITNQRQPPLGKYHVDQKQNDNDNPQQLEPSIKLVPKDLHCKFTKKEQMILKIDPMHCKRSIRSIQDQKSGDARVEIRFINSKLIEERMFLPQRPIMSQGHCRSLRCMRNFLRWPGLAKQNTNKKSGYQRMEKTLAGNGFAKDHTLKTALKGTKLSSRTLPYHKAFCTFLWFQCFYRFHNKNSDANKGDQKKHNHKIGPALQEKQHHSNEKNTVAPQIDGSNHSNAFTQI